MKVSIAAVLFFVTFFGLLALQSMKSDEQRIQSLEQQLEMTQHDLNACRLGQ